jgi:hypothetical protein
MSRRELTFYSRLDCIKLGVNRSNKVRKEVASLIVKEKLASFTLGLLFHICSCTSLKTHSTLLCTMNQTRSEHRRCVSCSVIEGERLGHGNNRKKWVHDDRHHRRAQNRHVFFFVDLFRARCSAMCTGNLILELLLEPFIFYFGTRYFHVRFVKEQMLAQ